MVAIPWRTGVNMREFVFYGTPAVENTAPALQRAQLAALNDIGVKVVRIFASHRLFSTQECIDRLRVALTHFDEFDMQAIVCLDDGLTGAGFYIKGTEGFHNQTQGHYNADFWITGAWRDVHLPVAKAFATAFRNNPAVLMWELGNELALHPRDGGQRLPRKAASAAFIQFARDVSGAIKDISPNHLVSTGLVNSRHVCALEDGEDVDVFSRTLYGLPSIDAVSIHYYAHDGERNYAGIELNTARALGKPFYVGEVGKDHGTGDRSGYYQGEINDWKGAGAFTVLPWAYDSSDHDVGVSDIYAFARIFGDYDGIRNIMRGVAAAVRRFALVSAQPKPLPDPAPGPADAQTVGQGASGSGQGTSAPVGTGTAASARSANPLTDSGSLIRLQYPMKWQYKIAARFDDPANYGGSVIQRREGMMFTPDTTMRPLEVLAAQRGVVSKVASYPPGYGNYVCIRHNWNGEDFVTWYAHLDRSVVSEGQAVSAGDVIGYAGDSGSATETSLFFTVQYLNKGARGYAVDYVIDPALLLDSVVPPLEESQFGADVTVPDGTIYAPGVFFKKIWQVRNSGNTTWGNGYRLAFFADNPMGAGAAVPIPTVKPGESVQVAVDLVAPLQEGSYQTTWKLQNANGAFFGAILYAQIVVKGQPGQPTDAPKRSLARFSADVTIPDRTRLKPGSKFTKTWRILNDGETSWDSTYTMAFSKDDQMGGPDSVPFPATAPRKTANVSVDLTAPSAPGTYRSTWQPRDPQGNPFDFEMYAEIVVDPLAGDPSALNQNERFASPIRGVKGQDYYIGLRFLDYIEYLADHQHKGVDYCSSSRTIGLPVVAAANGVVHFAKVCSVCTPDRPNFNAHGLTQAQRNQAFSTQDPWNFGFGSLVIIKYEWNAISAGGRRAILNAGFADGNAVAFAFYGHLNEIFVRQGDPVAAGMQFATLGDTGNSTTPHTHLEIRVTTLNSQRPLVKSAYKLINPLDMFSE